MKLVIPQYDYATWVPACPESINGLRVSNGVISFILAVVAFVFGIVIKTEYDSIVVYGRNVKTRGVSNALWLFYYFSSGLYFLANGTYMTWGPLNWRVADIFRLFCAVFEGMAILACSLALNHHRVHKSAPEREFQKKKQQEKLSTLEDEYFTGDSEADLPSIETAMAASVNNGTEEGLISSNMVGEVEEVSLLKALVPMPSEIILILLFIAYFVVYFLCETCLHKDSWSTYLLIGVCYLQALPILVNTATIIGKREFGPSKVSKFSLLMGCIFTLLLIQPIYTWATITPSVCILGFISPFDIVLLYYLIAFIFFFGFIITEHERQKEEFMSQYIKRSDVNNK